MSETQLVFERELAETTALMDALHAEQQSRASTYFSYVYYSAVQIQRLFRGYLGRRVFRQSLALKAALRIQRGFRAMRARRQARMLRFRVLCRKILRGMRGIRAKEELSHKELLSRVNHNMLIETQWRKAMGVGDTESSLLHALYRKKFMRKRIGAFFRTLYWTHSVVRYWRSLVVKAPDDTSADDDTGKLTEEQTNEAAELETAADVRDAEAGVSDRDLLALQEHLSASGSTGDRTKLKAATTAAKRPHHELSREELRRKQLAYTHRVHEENAKREAARAALLEKQREAARLAELERKRIDDEQQRLRMAHASALRDDLERRGLLAIKELQSKKQDELRREEDARARLLEAQQKIAAQVLSDETQQILKRKQRKSRRPH